MIVNQMLMVSVWVMGEDESRYYLMPHSWEGNASSHYVYAWREDDHILISNKQREFEWIALSLCRVADVKLAQEYR